MSERSDDPRLTIAQRCSIRTLKALKPEFTDPYPLYPGAEHYSAPAEVVMMTLHESGTCARDFMIAVGGCVTEIMR